VDKYRFKTHEAAKGTYTEEVLKQVSAQPRLQ
jgi:hypothetical protein